MAIFLHTNRQISKSGAFKNPPHVGRVPFADWRASLRVPSRRVSTETHRLSLECEPRHQLVALTLGRRNKAKQKMVVSFGPMCFGQKKRWSLEEVPKTLD